VYQCIEVAQGLTISSMNVGVKSVVELKYLKLRLRKRGRDEKSHIYFFSCTPNGYYVAPPSYS
jgi:hypothetical protein